jgi:hypothetical protein
MEAERDTKGFSWRSIIGGAAWVGRVFLIFAFGVAFAGALTASLSIFVGRMAHLVDLVLHAAGF